MEYGTASTDTSWTNWTCTSVSSYSWTEATIIYWSVIWTWWVSSAGHRSVVAKVQVFCDCLIDWKRLPRELRAPIKRPSRDGEYFYCCTVLINQSTSSLLLDDIVRVEVTLVPVGRPCSASGAVPPQEEEICYKERGSASQTGGENISTLKQKERECSSVT